MSDMTQQILDWLNANIDGNELPGRPTSDSGWTISSAQNFHYLHYRYPSPYGEILVTFYEEEYDDSPDIYRLVYGQCNEIKFTYKSDNEDRTRSCWVSRTW